ncbi:Hint domain-containing protein, partial [Streptomyces anulatus]|uniref:Hint domain-containing protein n=1 Tax=Streptomyces anulatus TaxID=1892 RepID=UPI003444910B
MGKALALDTPLPTPDGWTTMGEVEEGDYLIGADGRPTRVVATTGVMRGRPCYEVEFSDGTVIIADAQHQWRTTTRASRRQSTENKRTFHWSAESAERVRDAYEASMAEPDRLVTHREVVSVLGHEFRDVIHTVQRKVGMSGKVLTPVTDPVRSYLWNAPAYSRRELLEGLRARVTQPRNASTTAVHKGVVTTEEIARTLRRASGDRRPNHAVAVAAPFDLPERDLPLSPYALGVWLGDGHSDSARFTTVDPEIVLNLEAEGLWITGGATGPVYSMRLPRPAPVA